MFEDAVMAAGAQQPEKLAHYLDLVEVCLLKQISQRWGFRSPAFFSARAKGRSTRLWHSVCSRFFACAMLLVCCRLFVVVVVATVVIFSRCCFSRSFW